MATTPHTGSSPRTEEHDHGTMDIRAHERTFEGFVRAAAWTVVASLAILVFLALTNA